MLSCPGEVGPHRTQQEARRCQVRRRNVEIPNYSGMTGYVAAELLHADLFIQELTLISRSSKADDANCRRIRGNLLPSRVGPPSEVNPVTSPAGSARGRSRNSEKKNF